MVAKINKNTDNKIGRIYSVENPTDPIEKTSINITPIIGSVSVRPKKPATHIISVIASKLCQLFWGLAQIRSQAKLIWTWDTFNIYKLR